VRVVVRPEQVVLGPANAAGVPAEVTGRVFLGHDALVRLRLAGGAVVTSRSLGLQSVEVGDQVTLAVTGSVSAFPAS